MFPISEWIFNFYSVRKASFTKREVELSLLRRCKSTISSTAGSTEMNVNDTTDQETVVRSPAASWLVIRERSGERGNTEGVWVSVCGGTAVPEARPEVVAAGHEARVGGRVDDAAHDVVVSQGQQVLPLGRARVPAAQADGALVRQQHIVLCVVEDALRAVHLTAAQPRTWNRQEGDTSSPATGQCLI